MTILRVPCMAALLVAAVAAVAASPAAADLGVFQGDPIDPATSAPYVMLPGVPLVYPGVDGAYGTGDDVVDPQLVGDVDLVVRTQGTIQNGVIPPPAAGVASAPLVVAGGEHGTSGTRVPFQVIASDGVSPPAAGSALAAPELDLRGALVIAYPDLDGDGVIGPTGAASASLELQRQEALQMAGRRPAIFFGGVAAGSMGVSLGAPASAGGLGLAFAAAAATGATPGLYFDGPWIATALPYMLPLDPSTYFNSDGESSPDGVVEVEIEREELLLPAPDEPLLGRAYALPLDGSSPSIDLARSVSGPVTGVTFAVPVDPASFVAAVGRRVLPAFDAVGLRRLVEAADALALANDGPGGATDVLVFVADLLGNATDPSSGGTTVVVEAGPSLRLVAPDADGDPRRELLRYETAAFVTLTVDDDGAGGPAGEDRVVARLDGVPVAAVRVTLAEGPSASALVSARAVISRATKPARDRVTANAAFSADPTTLDPTTQIVTVTLQNTAGAMYTRSFAPGTLVANKTGTGFRFRDDSGTLVVKRMRRDPTKHSLRLASSNLDLGTVDLSRAELMVTLAIGSTRYESTLACRVAKHGRSTRCLK